MELLRHPSPSFKLFEPTDEKIAVVADKLISTPLFIEDQDRNEKTIAYFIDSFLMRTGFALAYEVPDFGGIVGFMDIRPGWKAEAILKLWDKSKYGAKTVREARDIMKLIMDTFDLKRLNTQTADPVVDKLARLCGFEREGLRIGDYMWGGQIYDRYILGYEAKE
jgi:uncharacterized protein (DUF2147 family)